MRGNVMRSMRWGGRAWWLAPVLMLALVVGVACDDDDDGDGGAASTPAVTATAAPGGTSAATAAPGATGAPTADEGSGQYDPTLVRDDVECTQAALSGDPEATEDSGIFEVAHFVVDGVLGQPCLGAESDALMWVWEALSEITPMSEMPPLAMLVGFRQDEEDSEFGVTWAYVAGLGDEGDAFLMAINLYTVEEEDQDEILLVLAHEFAHIFTQRPDQLDRDGTPGACEIFDNGEGCVIPGSFLGDFIMAFWDLEAAQAVDPFSPDFDDAAARCSVDPSFLGAYAASSPEEDFAEVFSAFVFDVPAATAGVQAKMDFFEQHPRLVAFRDRARAAGWTPLAGSWEKCG